MVVGVIGLFLAFVVARFLLVRNSVAIRTANIACAAIVIAFIVGSLARPFGFPDAGPQQSASSPATTSSDATPEPVADVRDVSAQCKAGRPAPATGVSGTVGVLDVVAYAKTGMQIPMHATIPSSASYGTLGWAADPHKLDAAAAVCLAVDGSILPRVRSKYGILRMDVAQAANASALAATGFSMVIPAHTLPRGRHTLGVYVKSHDGTYAAVQNTWDLVIE